MRIYWEYWNDSLIEAWIEIILHVLCCIVIVILTIFCLYRMHQNKKDKHVFTLENQFYVYMLSSLIVAVLYIHSTLFMVLSVLVLGWTPKLGCFYRQFSAILLTLQRTFTYYLYISRLYVSFQGSVAELFRKYKYLLIVSVTVTGIIVTVSYLMVMYSVTIIFGTFKCGFNLSRMIIQSIYILSDPIWRTIFTGFFVKKLIALMKSSNINDGKFRYMAKKLSLLTFISVITSISLFGIFMIIDLFPYQFISMDMIMNNITIMLTFKGLDTIFNKLCCCHKKCCNNKLNDPIKLSSSVNIDTPNNHNNNATGEPTGITMNNTTNISCIDTITQTQNEGKERITAVNDGNITKGFDIGINEVNSNDISFTSVIKNKNDSIIQKHLAANQIALYQITQQ